MVSVYQSKPLDRPGSSRTIWGKRMDRRGRTVPVSDFCSIRLLSFPAVAVISYPTTKALRKQRQKPASLSSKISDFHVPDKVSYYLADGDEPVKGGAAGPRLEELLRPAAMKFMITLRSNFNAENLVEAMKTYKDEVVVTMLAYKDEVNA